MIKIFFIKKNISFSKLGCLLLFFCVVIFRYHIREVVVVAPAPTTAPAPPSEAKASYSPGQDTEADSPNQEFVSDNFRPSSQDLEEVREGMKKLGLDPAPVKGMVSCL